MSGTNGLIPILRSPKYLNRSVRHFALMTTYLVDENIEIILGVNQSEVVKFY